MISIHLLQDKPEFIDKISEVNFNTWIEFYQNNKYEDITSVEEYKEYLEEIRKLIIDFKNVYDLTLPMGKDFKDIYDSTISYIEKNKD